MLLSRNKDFLVFYRGKNFLTPEVSEALLEKERLAKSLQDEEEQARLRSSTFYKPMIEPADDFGTAGTLGETLDAKARWGKILNDEDKEKVMKEAEVARHANLVKKLEKKLAFVSFLNICLYLSFSVPASCISKHEVDHIFLPVKTQKLQFAANSFS